MWGMSCGKVWKRVTVVMYECDIVWKGGEMGVKVLHRKHGMSTGFVNEGDEGVVMGPIPIDDIGWQLYTGNGLKTLENTILCYENTIILYVLWMILGDYWWQ